MRGTEVGTKKPTEHDRTPVLLEQLHSIRIVTLTATPARKLRIQTLEGRALVENGVRAGAHQAVA